MNTYTGFALTITQPPNPIRNLDNSLTTAQQAGFNFYTGNRRSDGLPIDITGEQDGFTCNGCHVLDPAQGFFGTGGNASFENEEQILKIPHLRNLYQKIGMFGMPNTNFFNPGDNSHRGPQVRGTGFLHDGSVDTLFRFFTATVFNSAFGGQVGFPNNQARLDMEQFMLAFDSDLAPIVGQQITLDAGNAGTVAARIDLLLQRAATPFVSRILGGSVTEADIVATGFVDGAPRGFARLPDGTFQSDDPQEEPLSPEALRDLVDGAGEFLTFTAVPPGSGHRIGVDRDRDGILNAVDLCPQHADPAQADDDGDGIGNACDNCILAANATQRDSNGDGFGNACDADLNQDGTINFVDLGLFKAHFLSAGEQDADFNGDNVVNFIDVGIMKGQFFGAPGPSAFNP
jgi:hypothetical protein